MDRFLRPLGGEQRPEGYLLGLDFDGTLAPLARRPELARLPSRTRRLLERLARLRRVRVVIASGRALPDLRAKVGLKGLVYVGNHGLEIGLPGARLWVHPQARALVRLMGGLAAALAPTIRELPGVLIENKGLTLSVHYRALPRFLSPKIIHELLERYVAPYRRRIRLAHGKKVWEIRPSLRWNKGFALRKLLRAHRGWTPVLVGDDQTDEEGFRTLGPKALTVRVGYTSRSAARFRVRTQKQVHALLEYFYREWKRR